MAEQVRANLALFEVAQEDAIDAARQEPGEVGLAHTERQLADVLAVTDQTIERIELHFVVMLAAVQAVEIRDAINTEQHGFPVDHKRGVAVAERGFT